MQNDCAQGAHVSAHSVLETGPKTPAKRDAQTHATRAARQARQPGSLPPGRPASEMPRPPCRCVTSSAPQIPHIIVFLELPTGGAVGRFAAPPTAAFPLVPLPDGRQEEPLLGAAFLVAPS